MAASSNLERRTLGVTAGASFVEQLDEWLRPACAWSLADEYPQIFGAGSMAFQHVLLDGDQLLAHAATLDLRFRGHGHELVVRLVGSVVAHPERRGEGHASVLLDAIREDFWRESPDVLILWSPSRNLYRRCGFEPLGIEHILQLGRASLGPILGLLRPARQDDVPALHALHAAKPVGTQRRHEDFERFLSIPRCETWVLEIDKEVRAYASIGKGLDFEDHIHEVGGLDPEVASLVSSLLMEKGRDLGLLLAPYRSDLRRLLSPFLMDETHSALGLGIVKTRLAADFYLEGFDSI